MAKGKRASAAGGVIVSTAITAGGFEHQHSEGIVVSTALTAGRVDPQHSEGLVARRRSYSAGGTSAAGGSA